MEYSRAGTREGKTMEFSYKSSLTADELHWRAESKNREDADALKLNIRLSESECVQQVATVVVVGVVVVGAFITAGNKTIMAKQNCFYYILLPLPLPVPPPLLLLLPLQVRYRPRWSFKLMS